jgi:hypothetical protein
VGGEFQPAKCKGMHVGIYNLAYKYFMRVVKLEETEVVKDFGVAVS